MLKAALVLAALATAPFFANADHHESADTCKGVAEACTKAGKKKDCVDKLVAGKKVAGVKVNDATLNDCKNHLTAKEDIAPKTSTPVPVPPVPAETPKKAK